MQHLGSHLLRFTGSGAVSYGKVFNFVFFDQGGQLGDGFFLFALAESGVDDGCIQHFARSVNNGNFATVFVSGVKPHGDFAFYRRLHQQRFQILREHFDRAFTCHIRQRSTAFSLHGRKDQAVIGIVSCRTDKLHGAAAGFDYHAAYALQSKLSVKINGNLQIAFLLTTINCQHTMPGDFVYFFGKIIILAVDGVFFRCRKRVKRSIRLYDISEHGADLSIV